MRHKFLLLCIGTGAVVLLLVASRTSSAQKQGKYWTVSSFSRFVEIPGATRLGAEACTACHRDLSGSFRHAFHQQQGVECEDCHGPGSLHVEGGGDVTEIVSYSKRDARNANGACLSCHAQDESVRNWMGGPHASNNVRCTDCHQIHSNGAKSDFRTRANVDLMTPGRTGDVENLVPETKVFTQPIWQANDTCLRCHQTQAAQMSLPYHHPLREGKMKCGDCHDPHGGAGGNNLRGASVNQLCLNCHAQYRGPFAYQHPPVNENCMLCHTAHGSPNTNLLSVSEPALCLQCHVGHHNGAGLPLTDRCTNCHPSIHGTDVATPSGGSRFVDKGPYGVPSEPPQPLVSASTAPMSAQPRSSLASQTPSFAAGFGGGLVGMI